MFNESRIIHGLMRLSDVSEEQLYDLIQFDLAHGITFFDIADCYGNGASETKLGNVLEAHPELREKMFIQSKCSIVRSPYMRSYYDLSYQHIIEAVDASLARLKTDHLDCLLLHRPDLFIDDEEVKKAFEELHAQGKVRYFGVSNFSKELMQYLLDAGIPMEANQVQLGLGHARLVQEVANFNLDNPYAPSTTEDTYFFMKRKHIRLQAWSPYQVGFFGGSLFNPELAPELNKLMDELCEKYQTSKCALATAWILRLWKGISVITGSMNKDHIQETLDGAKLEITKEDWYRLYRATQAPLP